MYYTYILRSLKSGRYYVGHTENLTKRLAAHNIGEVTATRSKGPWECVYSEIYESRQEANRREIEIKKKKSRIYIGSLINGRTNKILS